MALKHTVEARSEGVAVIGITHDPSRAYPVADRFMIFSRARSLGNRTKAEPSQTEFTQLTAGGAALEQPQHDLAQAGA